MRPLPTYISRALKSGKEFRAKLEDINVHEDMQPRDSVRKGPPDAQTKATIQRYTNAVKSENRDVFPPILLAYIEDKGIVLVDGWHRYEAHMNAGKDRILATVHPMTFEAAKWQAAKANQTHGRPMARKDYREIFRRYIAAKEHLDDQEIPKSYRQMAEDLGHIKAHTTIRNWVRDDFPALFKAITTEEEYSDEPIDTAYLREWKIENAERYTETAYYKAHENLKTLKKLDPERAERHAAYELERLSELLDTPIGDLPDWLTRLQQREKEQSDLEDF